MHPPCSHAAPSHRNIPAGHHCGVRKYLLRSRCHPWPCVRLSRTPWHGRDPVRLLRRLRPTPVAIGGRRAFPFRPLAVSGEGTPGRFPRSPADRLSGEVPSSTPAASPRLRRRHSPWPPYRQEQPARKFLRQPEGHRSAHRAQPESSRLELVVLKGVSGTGSVVTPSRLACRTRPVWKCRTVPALSGPLATPPGASRDGLPSASPPRCDATAVEVFHLHSINRRLVAHAPTERSVNLSVHSALLTVIRPAWMPRPSARTVRALDRGARSTMP